MEPPGLKSLSFQRNDPQRMVIFPGSCDRMIHIVCHNASRSRRYPPVHGISLLSGPECSQCPKSPALSRHLCFLHFLFSMAVSGREGSPAIFATFQKFDHAFCCLFPCPSQYSGYCRQVPSRLPSHKKIFTLIRSAITPRIPGFLSFCSITFRILFPYPS